MRICHRNMNTHTFTDEWTERLLESLSTKLYSQYTEGNINQLSDKFYICISHISREIRDLLIHPWQFKVSQSAYSC